MKTIGRSIPAPLALLLLLPALGACSGDDDGGDADPALAGTWELTRQGEVDSRYTFDDDGTFRFDELGDDESDEHVEGSYTTAGGVLTMEGANPDGSDEGRAETTYYAAGDRLAIGAYLPRGDHDGLVGTWAAHLEGEGLDGDEVIESVELAIEVELRADGTATMASSLVDDDQTFETTGEGTWAQVDDTVELSLAFDEPEDEGEQVLDTTMEILADDALGDVVYERAGSAARRRPGAPVRSAPARSLADALMRGAR